MTGKIATGEIVDIATDSGKNAAAVALRPWARRAPLACRQRSGKRSQKPG